MTPGRAPLDELAARLAPFLGSSIIRLRELLDNRPGEAARVLGSAIQVGTESQREPRDPADRKRLILIVDQFEEIFTLAEETERARFIEALERLAEPDGDPRGPTAMVILVLRADFYAESAGYPRLARALQSATFLVTPMTQSDIRAAIIQPAAQAGLTIEDGLVEVILRDAGSVSPQPELGAGVVPLLSQAMLATWQHRTGTTLTFAAYRASGGLVHSIERTAEMTYEGLNPAQRHAARALLSRMVTIGPDGRTMRRTLYRADRTSLAADNDMIAAMEALTRARLIMVQQDAIEIVHDALIHAWPGFRQWLAEDAARIQLIGQLAQSSRAWEEGGRDPTYLYSGTRLAAALASLDDQHDIPAADHEFLAASLRFQRHRSRRRHSLVAVLLALLLSLVLVTFVAVRQAETAAAQRAIVLSQAAAQRAIASSQQVAFESQTVSDPNISALLAVAAWRIAPTSQANNSLITAFARENVTTLTRETGSVLSLAFSPDDGILAIADSDGTLQLWNLATSRQIAKLHGTSANLTEMAYDPNGRILATAGSDGMVQLWDVEIGKYASLRAALRVGTGLTWVAFSPDGTILATTGQGEPIRLWDVTTGQLRSSRVLPDSYGASDVKFSPDGRTLAAVTAAGDLGLWNATTGQQIFAIPSPAVGGRISSVAFSPDGRTVATGGTDAAVRLWSATTGMQTGTLQTGNGSTQVAFNPNGSMLATASTDGTVRLWDMTTNRQIGAPLTADGINEAAFSTNGRTLATVSVSANPTVQLWKLPTTTSATQLSRAICAKVGHDLTLTQWAQYVPDTPYQSSCRS